MGRFSFSLLLAASSAKKEIILYFSIFTYRILVCMMKRYLLLLLASLMAVAIATEKYTRKYDDVDVDKILQNNRVLTNYIRCLMDEGPCTADGRELKKTLPDALSSGCSKCNDKQKTIAEKVINYLKTKRSRDWDRLIAKYDPHGEYKRRYEKS